jgi:hypothetical protein
MIIILHKMRLQLCNIIIIDGKHIHSAIPSTWWKVLRIDKKKPLLCFRVHSFHHVMCNMRLTIYRLYLMCSAVPCTCICKTKYKLTICCVPSILLISPYRVTRLMMEVIKVLMIIQVAMMMRWFIVGVWMSSRLYAK